MASSALSRGFHFTPNLTNHTANTPTEGENMNNHKTPATAVATAYGQKGSVLQNVAGRIARLPMTAKSSKMDSQRIGRENENCVATHNDRRSHQSPVNPQRFA